MIKNNNFVNIVTLDEEGDRCRINDFMTYDILPLLKMERIIVGKIEAKEVAMKEVINVIEDAAMKCGKL